MRPLRFGQEFIELLHLAEAREKLRKSLPKRRRGHCRILASDGSIHDFPQKHISQALGIDPELTLIDNAAIVKFDRSLRRTYRMVMAAYFGPQRHDTLSAARSQRSRRLKRV